MIRVQLYTVQYALSDFCTCTRNQIDTLLYNVVHVHVHVHAMHCHVMDNRRILSANALPATTGVRTLARGTPPAQSPIAPRSIRAAGDGGRYFIGQLKGVAVERHHVKSRGDGWVKNRPSSRNDVRRAWR